MNEDGKLIRVFPTLSGRNLTVEDMDLEVAVRNALKRSGIHTVDQLLQLSHPELVQIFPNRKLRSYEDVIHRLVCLSEEADGMDTAAPEFVSVQNIGNLLEKSKMSDKKNIFPFNIFQVGEYWKAEEFHTKVIAELINPQSKFHDKGTVFLGKFLKEIDVKISDEELEDAEVKTEARTGEDRRIDMVISTESHYLPFEVKIGAEDQNAQLQDYYAFSEAQAEKQGKKVPTIYYLTPSGREPSPQSLGTLSNKQVICLSFTETILPWLKHCMEDSKIPPDVEEIMKQLRDNIAGQPGSQGFSKWTWGVLDIICLELSRKYNLRWTECKNRCKNSYKMFTLNKKGPLEFALRVEEEDNRNQVGLYLVCGLTRKDGEEPNYSYPVTTDYISKNPEKFGELLEATFQDGGNTLDLKTEPDVWNRLPEKDCYKKLNADDCRREIEKIFEELNPRVCQALKRK